MLYFTKTTIINDAANVCVKDGLWKADGTRGKKFVVKWSDELYVDDEHCPRLLKKTAYKAAVPASATVTLPTAQTVSATETNLFRIVLYIRLRNNNSSMYSNQWTFKGKPFVVEFKGGTTAADLKDLIEKHELFQYGKRLLNVSTAAGSGNNAPDDLVLTATDQWQFFATQDNGVGVQLEHLVKKSFSYVSGMDGEEWEAMEGTKAVSNGVVTVTYSSPAATVVVNNGNEAFGDFAHIVKDLRLPTTANLRWEGIAQGDVFGGEPNDDKPMPMGHYTQYVIQYDVDRGVQQQTALGGLATSRTTHVFFVEAAAVSGFESILGQAGITAKGYAHNENNRSNLDDVAGSIYAKTTVANVTDYDPNGTQP